MRGVVAPNNPDFAALRPGYADLNCIPCNPLIVIHKCWKLVILAWMPKSRVQGWLSISLGSGRIRHRHNHQVTVHGLDTGIHAGMTAFLARRTCV